jgi:hypothetical protein
VKGSGYRPSKPGIGLRIRSPWCRFPSPVLTPISGEECYMANIRKPNQKQFREAMQTIKQELRAAESAWSNLQMGRFAPDPATPTDVYAALERAQHAAFDAKNMFAVEV